MEAAIRPCEAADCGAVMRLVRELAEFEKLADQVQTSDRALREDGFANDPFYRCLVAEVPPERRSREGHAIVGYALYFFTYSTWKGRSLYLEDLYVTPAFRGQGLGKKLLGKTAEIGLEKGCTQLRFAVLDWNRAAIDFYQGRGAVDLTAAEGWRCFRFDREALERLARDTGSAPSSRAGGDGNALDGAGGGGPSLE